MAERSLATNEEPIYNGSSVDAAHLDVECSIMKQKRLVEIDLHDILHAAWAALGFKRSRYCLEISERGHVALLWSSRILRQGEEPCFDPASEIGNTISH